ncbi:MAG: hypothetical protein ACO3K7_06300, partial [Candidatus Marinamargulisbacteria bacterium]
QLNFTTFLLVFKLRQQGLNNENFGNTTTQQTLIPAPVKLWVMTHLDLIITALQEGGDTEKIVSFVEHNLTTFFLKKRSGWNYAFSGSRWLGLGNTSHKDYDDEIITVHGKDRSLASWQLQTPARFYADVHSGDTNNSLTEDETALLPHTDTTTNEWDSHEREQIKSLLIRLKRRLEMTQTSTNTSIQKCIDAWRDSSQTVNNWSPKPITLLEVRQFLIDNHRNNGSGHGHIKDLKNRYLMSPWEIDLLLMDS